LNNHLPTEQLTQSADVEVPKYEAAHAARRKLQGKHSTAVAKQVELASDSSSLVGRNRSSQLSQMVHRGPSDGSRASVADFEGGHGVLEYIAKTSHRFDQAVIEPVAVESARERIVERLDEDIDAGGRRRKRSEHVDLGELLWNHFAEGRSDQGQLGGTGTELDVERRSPLKPLGRVSRCPAATLGPETNRLLYAIHQDIEQVPQHRAVHSQAIRAGASYPNDRFAHR
jgi:hypothetical protein